MKQNLITYIAEQSQSIDPKNSDKIANLALYKVLQQPYFGNNYKFLELSKGNGYSIYHGSLTGVSLATNNYVEPKKYKYRNGIFEPQHLQDFEDTINSKKKEQIRKRSRFLNPEKKEIFLSLYNILEQSEKIEDVAKPLFQLFSSYENSLSIIDNIKYSTDSSYEREKSIIKTVLNILSNKELKDYDSYRQLIFEKNKKNIYRNIIINPSYKQETKIEFLDKNKKFFADVFGKSLFSRTTSNGIKNIYRETKKYDNQYSSIIEFLKDKLNKTTNQENFLKDWRLKNEKTNPVFDYFSPEDFVSILFDQSYGIEKTLTELEELSLSELIKKSEHFEKSPLNLFNNLEASYYENYIKAYDFLYFKEEKEQLLSYLEPIVKNKNTQEIIDNIKYSKSVKEVVNRAIQYFGLDKQQEVSYQLDHYNNSQFANYHNNSLFSSNPKKEESTKILEKHSYSILSLKDDKFHNENSVFNDNSIRAERDYVGILSNNDGFIISNHNNLEVLSNVIFLKSENVHSYVNNFNGYDLNFVSTKPSFLNQGYATDVVRKGVEECIKQNKSICMSMSTENSSEFIYKIILKLQREYKDQTQIFILESIRRSKTFTLEKMAQDPELYGIDKNHSFEELLGHFIYYSSIEDFNSYFIHKTHSQEHIENFSLKEEKELYDQVKKDFIQNIIDKNIKMLQNKEEFKKLERNYYEKKNNMSETFSRLENMAERSTTFSLARDFFDNYSYINNYYGKKYTQDQKNEIKVQVTAEENRKQNKTRKAAL